MVGLVGLIGFWLVAGLMAGSVWLVAGSMAGLMAGLVWVVAGLGVVRT